MQAASQQYVEPESLTRRMVKEKEEKKKNSVKKYILSQDMAHCIKVYKKALQQMKDVNPGSQCKLFEKSDDKKNPITSKS